MKTVLNITGYNIEMLNIKHFIKIEYSHTSRAR